MESEVLTRIPFSTDELSVVGSYPSFNPAVPGAKKYNTPIPPRVNTLAFLRGEKPLWIPRGADGVTLIPRIIPDNVARVFVFDANPLTPDESTGGLDMFGIKWVFVPQVNGSMVEPGNPTFTDANEWQDHIKEPNIDEWDWAGSAERNAAFIGTGRATTIWMMTGLFERLISFMDFENAAVALIDDDQKDAVHEIFSFLCDVYEKQIDRYQKFFEADIIYFHDDWGAQRSPFFSLDVCMEMIVPYLKRLSDYCHSKEMFLNLHCCGAVEDLVPAMVAAGCDIWSGQDFNNKKRIFDNFGDQIVVEVGSPIPLMVPGGSPPEPEKGIEAAEKWMELYGNHFEQKKAIASGGNVESYIETIYEKSRILLG
ncbi:MAG: methyltransferase [Coriobacteriia bacterium]|nr:methyltransferase [Coriobacteriia bacterium]